MAKLVASAFTDAGRVRSENQDRVWAQVYQSSQGEPLGLFIVCDGVGGHQGGQFASHWAVETIKSEFEDHFCPGDPRRTILLAPDEINRDATPQPSDATRISELRKMEEMVQQAVQNANWVVYEYARQKPSQAADAGTTLTMAVLYGARAVIANVGDSRAYHWRKGKMRQITRDHSLVAKLVENGQIKPQEVFSHPQRNLIFRSLGQKQEIDVDTFVEFFEPGDLLLLCTDGLWEMLPDEQHILDLLRHAHDPDEACHLLVEAANQAGGQDNIGVVVVAIQ